MQVHRGYIILCVQVAFQICCFTKTVSEELASIFRSNYVLFFLQQRETSRLYDINFAKMGPGKLKNGRIT
jgi:hypothetical protein